MMMKYAFTGGSMHDFFKSSYNDMTEKSRRKQGLSMPAKILQADEWERKGC